MCKYTNYCSLCCFVYLLIQWERTHLLLKIQLEIHQSREKNCRNPVIKIASVRNVWFIFQLTTSFVKVFPADSQQNPKDRVCDTTQTSWRVSLLSACRGHTVSCSSSNKLLLAGVTYRGVKGAGSSKHSAGCYTAESTSQTNEPQITPSVCDCWCCQCVCGPSPFDLQAWAASCSPRTSRSVDGQTFRFPPIRCSCSQAAVCLWLSRCKWMLGHVECCFLLLLLQMHPGHDRDASAEGELLTRVFQKRN